MPLHLGTSAEESILCPINNGFPRPFLVRPLEAPSLASTQSQLAPTLPPNPEVSSLHVTAHVSSTAAHKIWLLTAHPPVTELIPIKLWAVLAREGRYRIWKGAHPLGVQKVQVGVDSWLQ